MNLDDSHGQTPPPPCASWRWWTVANGLTFVRLLLAPALAATLVGRQTSLALVIFMTAIVSDLVDGRIARLRGEVSALGGFFDHATDALFVATGLFALAHRGLVPWALPILLLFAFAQYALDSKALAGRPLRASRLGRWNGIAYFVVLGTPVVRDGLGLGFPDDTWVGWLGGLLVVSTLVSIGDRAWALLRR
jgi:phosphatidylglycerophosphate synthase